MSEIELKVAKREDAEEWNKLVDISSHGTIFHTWEWLKIVEKHTEGKLYPLIGYKGTEPVGIYPFFYIKKFGIKIALSPPPKVLMLYLGPAFAKYEKIKQDKKELLFINFQQALDQFLEDLGCNYTRIRTPPGLIDSRPLKWAGYKVDPLYTYFIDLGKGLEYVWNNLTKSLRRSIEKAKKAGLIVEEGDKEDLEFVRVAMYNRFREMGSKVPKHYYKQYLADIYDAFFPEHMKIFTAKYNNDKIGGIILLCYKHVASYWFGIPKINLKGIYPNDLIQWEAIKWAYGNGYRLYEEMDAGDDPRLRHFKAKFNPDLVPWYSATKYSSQFYKIAEIIFNFIRRKY